MVAILIVEDDADLAETYQDLLQARGHSIEVAATVRAAVKYLTHNQPSVIILDLSLPDDSGFEIVKYVREHGADNTRLLIISGHSEMARHSDLAHTSDLVLNKPVSNDQLLTLIERITCRSAALSRGKKA